jgi:hypothetical protein
VQERKASDGGSKDVGMDEEHEAGRDYDTGHARHHDEMRPAREGHEQTPFSGM